MRVHHLAFRTDDIARLAAFYREVVGLGGRERPAGATGPSVWLDAGGTMIMIEARGAGEPPIPSGCAELVAFAISPSEKDAVALRLAAAGVAIEQRTAFTLYFRDPDGRRVAVSHYPEKA